MKNKILHIHSIQISLIIFLMVLSSQTRAQDVRIPFRVGDKFGLSNEKGKLTVEAKYDKVKFMDYEFQFFQYTNIIKDSIKNVYGGYSENNRKNSGVIHKDKVIIENTPFGYFHLYKSHFITGSLYNSQRPEDFMLYNLKGEPLLEEIASHIYINDRRDIGYLGLVDPNLQFVSIFHRGKRRERKFSIGIYDLRTQKIEKWLIYKSSDFKLRRSIRDKNAVSVQYVDKEGYQSKYIYYDGNKGTFEIRKSIDTNLSKPKSVQRPVIENLKGKTYYNNVKKLQDARLPSPSSNVKREIPFRENFRFKKNELYYGTAKVVDIEGAEFFKMNAVQNQPIIYKKDGKYGFVKDYKSYTQATYDSLVNMRGPYSLDKDSNFTFLVGKFNSKTKEWKYGVINENEKVIIPMEYDCLIPHIPNLDWEFFSKYFDKPLSYFTAPIRRSYSKKRAKFYFVKPFGLLGSKDGKIGIVNLENKIFFPFKYEGIYFNDLSFTNPVRSYGKYYIVRKKGKFAIVKDLETPQKQLRKMFIFPRVPSSIYPNYGGKEGFNLVRLVESNGNTFCYASEEGFLYYKDK